MRCANTGQIPVALSGVHRSSCHKLQVQCVGRHDLALSLAGILLNPLSWLWQPAPAAEPTIHCVVQDVSVLRLHPHGLANFLVEE
jgi:hypothetical protein